ncbi:DgyrCDS5233 [Dimorphilus gyrociliatus]|uniref:DgyrCDS5233 n=1 Tax=Dimorphilus gyrociliatus TaxID=2664684 RepID=A0A7I8VJ72_9ANNE|nr:DgyrCDS5233 [Dimorphilus gyrociliatus]
MNNEIDTRELDRVLEELKAFSVGLEEKRVPVLQQQERVVYDEQDDSLDLSGEFEYSSITSSQESLVAKMKKQKELRIKDEEIHAKEKKRLDEILSMLEDYGVQQSSQVEKNVPKLKNDATQPIKSYATDENDYDELHGYDNFTAPENGHKLNGKESIKIANGSIHNSTDSKSDSLSASSADTFDRSTFEMERALLEGERNSESEILQALRNRCDEIERKGLESIRGSRIDNEQVAIELERERFEIERLEVEITQTQKEASLCQTGEELENYKALEKKQRESLEHHQRVFEEWEFQLLEIEARIEEQRERVNSEIDRERSEIKALVEEQEAKVQRIDGELKGLISLCEKDVRNFEQERNQFVLEFQQTAQALVECDALDPNLNGNIELPSEPPASGWVHMSDAFYQLHSAVEQRSKRAFPQSPAGPLAVEYVNHNSVKLAKFENKPERPLTRYLPVPDDATFDLKQHLESAGHHLGDVTDVFVTNICCQGWLQKLGGSRPRRWQKRWFVLDRRRRILSYYSSKPRNDRSSPRSSIGFDDISEVYVQNSNGSPGSAFCVLTKQRTLTLCSATPQSRAIWMDAIFLGGAHGYKFNGVE